MGHVRSDGRLFVGHLFVWIAPSAEEETKNWKKKTQTNKKKHSSNRKLWMCTELQATMSFSYSLQASQLC